MSRLHNPVSSRDHVQGPDDAPVTLVEYGDYQCPVCGEAYGYVKQVQERFGEQLRFVFRNFPIPELHPEAMAAANVAEYCATQGKFWAAHDLLYANQDELGPDLYEAIARQLGVSVEDMQQAVATDAFGDRIQDDENGGLRSGVNGTPTFYVNGRQLVIAQSFDEIADAVAQALGEQP